MRPREWLRYGGFWVKVLKPLFPEESLLEIPSKEALSYFAILNTVKTRGTYRMITKGGKSHFKDMLRFEVEKLHDSWIRMEGELNFTVNEAFEHASAIVEAAWLKVFPPGAETPEISGEKYGKELNERFYGIRSDLAEELTKTAQKLGRNVKDMVNEAVEQEIAANQQEVSLRQTLEFRETIKLCSNYGLYLMPTEPLNQILGKIKTEELEGLKEEYRSNGALLGVYLRTRGENEALRYFKRIFETGIFRVTSLDLSRKEEFLEIKCVAPTLNDENTKLLTALLEGLAEGIGFKIMKSDRMRGIILLTAKSQIKQA